MPARFIVSFGSTTDPGNEWSDLRGTNTLYYQGVDNQSEIEQLAQYIATQYASLNSNIILGFVKVAGYFFDGVSPSGPPATVKTAQQVSPVAVGPREVALCLSYGAGVYPGVPRGRGRIYIGPFGAGEMSEYPSTGLMNILLAHGQALYNAGSAAVSSQWSLYSPTVQAFTALTWIAVDNAWDTQRSRGLERTVKTVAALAI